MADQPPDEESLRIMALSHLARYATTTAGLRLVLRRRVSRWSRGREDADPAALITARAAIEAVIGKLTASGALDDAAYAAARAEGLRRAGHSTRGIMARLTAKGIDASGARAAINESGVGAATEDNAEAELDAALVVTRRRRIGAYRLGEETAETRRRALGFLARAGFSSAVATRALDTAREEADERIRRLRL
jgi:regulatory protein